MTQIVHKAMVKWGHVLFKSRDAVFPIVFVAIALVSKPYLTGDRTADYLLDSLGLAMAVVGQSLRATTVGLAYIKRGGKDRKIYADRLVQEGMFAHSRNPLYLGNMLILVGLATIHGSFWMMSLCAPFFIISYLCIILAEEDFLRQKFGQTYADYCQRVNRLIPSPWGMRRTFRGFTFDWRKLILKEYGTPFAWISAALALLLWQRAAYVGLDGAHGLAVVLLSIWAVVLVAYIAARVLKKTGTLSMG